MDTTEAKGSSRLKWKRLMLMIPPLLTPKGRRKRGRLRLLIFALATLIVALFLVKLLAQ